MPFKAKNILRFATVVLVDDDTHIYDRQKQYKYIHPGWIPKEPKHLAELEKDSE